jgi:hypothetical protein
VKDDAGEQVHEEVDDTIDVVPPIIPSGRLRSGRLISPAAAWYQPSKLRRRL